MPDYYYFYYGYLLSKKRALVYFDKPLLPIVSHRIFLLFCVM